MHSHDSKVTKNSLKANEDRPTDQRTDIMTYRSRTMQQKSQKDFYPCGDSLPAYVTVS